MTVSGEIVRAIASGVPFSFRLAADRARRGELVAFALRVAPVWYRIEARERRKAVRLYGKGARHDGQ